MSQSITMSKKRIAVLLILSLSLMGLLILRVFYIQVFMSGKLKKGAEDQRFRAISILPRRGTIYDRLGNEMAISIDAESVFAIPKEVGMEEEILNNKGRKAYYTNKTTAKKSEIAKIVGGVLALEPGQIEQAISKQASFVWIKRKASLEEIERLRRVLKRKKIRGIEISQSPRRFYPQNTLAAQLLGIAGVDNQGLEGLEKYLDHYLQGIPGSDRAEFDTLGHHIPQGERRYQAPVDGDSVYLTIDRNIQYIVERELEKAVTDTNSKRGMSITVNPQTGEILALACYPTFDPNKFNEYPAANRRNPLFSDMYEPGSTFKVFTAATALEEGKVTPESTFFDPGYIVVDDRRLKCWKAGGHGSQNFVEALENSCNPVFATLAMRITKERFYDYIKAFGFGSLTGVDFPGESAGMLKPLSQVRNVELANIGFGQGITVTPIQMVMGMSAVANGGYLLRPQLIKSIQGPDGSVKRGFKRQVVRQVISGKTSAMMRLLLESVVTNGSGNKAYLPGYRVAGKTGTAQKVVPGRRGYSQLIASFIGFAPADNPQILTMFILDEPNSPVKYGGVIAAPAVGNIFRDALRYLGVKPQYEPELTEKLSQETISVPNLLNQPLAEAIKQLKAQGLDYRVIGKGNLVFDQVPKGGTEIARGTKVILYLDPESKYRPKSNGLVVIPDLQGLSVAQSEKILSQLGLKLEAQGSGVAVSQIPAPGRLMDVGGTVRVIYHQ